MNRKNSNHNLILQLQDWSAELWREQSYKSAVKTFVSLLENNFGLFQVDYFQLDQKDKAIELRKGAIRFPNLSQLSDRVSRALQQKVILLFGSTALEAQEGWSSLDVAGETLQIAFLNEPTGQTALLAWKQPTIGVASPAYRRLGNNTDEIVGSLDFLVRQIQSSSTWFRRLDEAQSLLYQDDLTGLFNYRFLDTALESEFRRQSRFLTPFCILFIDLDGFKSVNDAHGHLVGSRVLKEVGHLIKDAVRDVDIVIRYGGDEFVVLLIGAATPAGLLAAERIRKRVEAARFSTDSKEIVQLTTSIGVACCPEHGTDKATILRNADTTMYESKSKGKNRVSVVKSNNSTEENGAFIDQST